MADLPPLPPRQTDQPRQVLSRPAAATGRTDNRPAKPDPRPMRVVYGAGAVAVASVMAVGLVRPDFSATADPQPSTDPNVADANTGLGRSDQSANNNAQANVQVRHVVRYIHLKLGQTAPPGATVITPGQPTPRIVTANNPAPAAQPPAHHNPPPVNNPPVNNPPAKNPPPVHQPPPPTPRPTTKTHQSGHP